MSEAIVPEEQEDEYKWVVLYGKGLYTFIAVCLIVVSTISYNAYTANLEARKANTSLTIQKASTGAKIGQSIEIIENNKKEWTKKEKEQEKLNESTAKEEANLEKLNISLIK